MAFINKFNSYVSYSFLVFPSGVLTMCLLDGGAPAWQLFASPNGPSMQPAPTPKTAYLWDDELPGFGLKITPAGRKVYLVQYRLGGRKGRTRRFTIGQHGELTPTAARNEAKRLLGKLPLDMIRQATETR